VYFSQRNICVTIKKIEHKSWTIRYLKDLWLQLQKPKITIWAFVVGGMKQKRHGIKEKLKSWYYIPKNLSKLVCLQAEGDGMLPSLNSL